MREAVLNFNGIQLEYVKNIRNEIRENKVEFYKQKPFRILT